MISMPYGDFGPHFREGCMGSAFPFHSGLGRAMLGDGKSRINPIGLR